MMINKEATQTEQFRLQLRDSLLQETKNSRALKIAKHANVYNCGDRDEMVYFIERGQVKLIMASPEGKECILAVLTAGDVFGELMLSGLGERKETATAMEFTELKKITAPQFLLRLRKDSLLEEFIKYLVMRIADQQQVIAHLVTIDSEQRLGETLLQLARSMGTRKPDSTRIELKITHEELSNMVGTTRPRVSLFMQRFRNLGLIETDKDHFLEIKEEKLANYLSQIR